MADSTLRVSAKQMREAAARAGGFDHLTINDVQAVMDSLSVVAGREQIGEKRSKYRNVRTAVDGETFDSKKEAQHWHELKLREKAGEISGLRRQVECPLYCPELNVTDGDYRPFVEVTRYIADFVFFDVQGSKTIYQDVKGGRATQTQLYKLKKKWLELQSGIVIDEI